MFPSILLILLATASTGQTAPGGPQAPAAVTPSAAQKTTAEQKAPVEPKATAGQKASAAPASKASPPLPTPVTRPLNPPPSRPVDRIEVPGVLIRLIEQVDVPAREAGVLASVCVREGQMVAEGELLAQVVDDEARIAEDRARIEVQIANRNAGNDVKVRFAQKSFDVARAELRRSEASVEKYAKSVSETEMDRLRLLVEKGELEVEQSRLEFDVSADTRLIKENEHRSAQEKVKRHKIPSPLTGMVVQISRHRGEWVRPGDTVIRLLRLDSLRAEGFLKAEFVARNLQNCPVKLKVTTPGGAAEEFIGKVVFLHPEIDPVNVQIRIWAEIDNRGLRLRPGMRAEMVIESPR